MLSNRIVSDNVLITSRTGATQVNLSASGTAELYINGTARVAESVTNPIYNTNLEGGAVVISGSSSVLLDTPNLYVSENIIMTPVSDFSSSNFQLTGVGANSIDVGSTSNSGTLLITANGPVFSELEMGSKTALTSNLSLNLITLSGTNPINMTCSQLNVNNAVTSNITTSSLRATNTISSSITTTGLNATGATIGTLNISSINSSANLTISNLSVTGRTDLFDTYIDYATCVDCDSTRSNITDMQGTNIGITNTTTTTLIKLYSSSTIAK